MSFTNTYKIDGDITTIYLKQRNGKIFETFIDTNKLPLLFELGLPWHVRYNSNIDGYYAHATKYIGLVDGKYKNVSLHLHKVVLGIEQTREILVDHKNNNTLDNRLDNLRLVDYSGNSKNRKDKNKNNTSGYRNVSWLNSYGKWCVQMQIDGKNTLLGKFDDVHEAGEFARLKRLEIYGKE